MIDSFTYTREEIAPDTYYEWLHDRRIILYAVGSHEEEAINRLADFILATMQGWNPNQPYLSIYEVTSPRAVFTRHARTRLSEVTAASLRLNGKTAAVIPFMAFNHAIRLFTTLRKHDSRRRRVFTSREEAIQWLLSD